MMAQTKREAAMQIKPYDRTIKAIFESGFYVIPRFQRPYSWTKENISDFWADVSIGMDDYFIGSMVFYKEKGQQDVHNVVDGQQRLTSIVLLLRNT